MSFTVLQPQTKLVFIEELSVGKVAETRGAADADGASSAESDDEELIPEFITNKREVTLKEYYDVAIGFTKSYKGAQAMETSWPPSSVDLSTTQVLKMVSIMQFNYPVQFCCLDIGIHRLS